MKKLYSFAAFLIPVGILGLVSCLGTSAQSATTPTTTPSTDSLCLERVFRVLEAVCRPSE